MSDIPSLLQPLKDRLAAATPGPWVTRDFPMPGATVDEWFSREIVHPNAGFHPLNVLKVRGSSNAARECCWPPNKADAAFIANAPTDQAKLIAAIEAVEALCADAAEQPVTEIVPVRALAGLVRAALTQALGGDTA